MTNREAYEALHEARQAIHRVAQSFPGHEVACAGFDVSHSIDALRTAIYNLTSRPVPADKLRAGDVVAILHGDAPDMTVAVAEYSPRSGCIAFRVGFESPDGVHFMHTPGWSRDGHYGWGSTFYAAPDAAERINARTDLYREAYPEEAVA